MNKKHLIRARCVVAASLALLLFAGTAAGKVLYVPQKYQLKSQWCWNASSQAILAYYGRNISQASIGKYGTKGYNIANYIYGTGYLDGVYCRGCDKILSYYLGIKSKAYASSLSQATVWNEITYNRPVLIRWGWNNGGGHILVLKGLGGTTATLMDPWYGPTVNSFNWVRSGGGHSWTHSVRLTSSPLWRGAANIGNGWRYLSWFGYFKPLTNGWIWHRQLGYVHCQGTYDGFWMYVKDRGESWYTSRAKYPTFYRKRDGKWYWYRRQFTASSTAKHWCYRKPYGPWRGF